MSNINHLSREIKKKLSFGDYQASAAPQPVQPVQTVQVTQPIQPVQPMQVQAVQTVQPMQSNHAVHAIPIQAQQPGPDRIQDQKINMVRPAEKEIEKREKKIKVTYYLSDEDNNVLTDIYISRLQNKNKTDKSALIAEAIKLLYKKETNL